jgi:hypothetical protein
MRTSARLIDRPSRATFSFSGALSPTPASAAHPQQRPLTTRASSTHIRSSARLALPNQSTNQVDEIAKRCDRFTLGRRWAGAAGVLVPLTLLLTLVLVLLLLLLLLCVCA